MYKAIAAAVIAVRAAMPLQVASANEIEAHRSSSVPLIDDGVILRIPVTMFDKTLYFIIDTGSSISFLDMKYQETLGTPISTGAVSTPLSKGDQVPIYRAPDFWVGKSPGGLKQVLCTNLTMFEYVSGEPCDGILGMDFFQGRILHFDFDAHSVVIFDRVPENLKQTAVVLPLRALIENQVGLDALINSTATISLKIDTGDNGSISLNQHDWDDVVARSKDVKIVATQMVSLNRDVTGTSAVRLHSVKIGSHEYQNMLCNLSPSPEARSTIGTAFLRRHLVTFDFPNQTLYLALRKTSNEFDEMDMSGLHLLRREGKTLVYSVDEGSPAARVDIQPGDLINSIDGKSVAQMKMKDIRQRLKANDGDKVVLEINHRGAVKSVTVVLRKAL